MVFTILFGVLAILTSWITPGGRVFFFWARLWGKGWVAAAGLRLRVRRASDLDPDRGYVFMANHQSALDIPVLLATLPVVTRFLAKRELFRIPLFGWALRAGGFIPVDRKDRSRARETLRQAADRLAEGSSVLLFPEETRSLDGRLLPFKRGGFLLAWQSGAPVVPVGLEGTGRAQRPHGFRVRPGVVHVRYGAPVPVAASGARERRALEERIRSEIGELAGIPPEDPSS